MIHSTAYSFIGFQTAYLAVHWNPIYWNTACLIVNSGSLEDNSEEEIVDIYEDEYQELIEGTTFEDLPDRSGKIKKTSSKDYAKIATAIGDIITRGIKVSLIDINRSDFGFKPDEKNNEILFGLNGLSGLNSDIINRIIAGRPYKGIADFMSRCPLDKRCMISLIKSGAFDNEDESWAKEISTSPRKGIMAYYISKVSEPKKKLNLQNFNGLVQKNLIPDNFKYIIDIYRFNKFLKDSCKKGNDFILSASCLDFYQIYFDTTKIEIIDGIGYISQKEFDKLYKAKMKVFSQWLTENQKEMLKAYNNELFKDYWNKYAKGSVSAWEMEALCFYYHEHELKNVNKNRYGIIDFNRLPREPEVDYYFSRGGKDIPIYKTHRIIGTVIAKNTTKSTVSLLTLGGVVTLKFNKEQFALYNRQISEKNEEGIKKVVEKSWFSRGQKIMVTGFRREDMFVVKTYKKTLSHQIYLIKNVDKDGNIELVHERYGLN